jgi:hypothetical protein
MVPRQPRIPTLDECLSFDGAHCHAIWKSLAEDWRCPGCQRTKFEILRWTRRKPPGASESFMGWLAAFHTHHDHGSDRFGVSPDGSFLIGPRGPRRFEDAIICDHCNAADGTAKRKLGLPAEFSFSAVEIGEFVTATPHAGHVLDYDAAQAIYDRLMLACAGKFHGRSSSSGLDE